MLGVLALAAASRLASGHVLLPRSCPEREQGALGEGHELGEERKHPAKSAIFSMETGMKAHMVILGTFKSQKLIR